MENLEKCLQKIIVEDCSNKKEQMLIIEIATEINKEKASSNQMIKNIFDKKKCELLSNIDSEISDNLGKFKLIKFLDNIETKITNL